MGIPFNPNQSSDLFALWYQRYATPAHNAFAENLSARRDMVTLITFIRDHKVIGTQSTGNLPLKVVRAVTAQFVDPPVLDTKIGERVYRLRTEEDIWPLFFLHILGEVGNLFKPGRAKKWRVTKHGHQFLKTPALVQTAYLLSVWWFETKTSRTKAFWTLGDRSHNKGAERIFFGFYALFSKQNKALSARERNTSRLGRNVRMRKSLVQGRKIQIIDYRDAHL